MPQVVPIAAAMESSVGDFPSISGILRWSVLLTLGLCLLMTSCRNTEKTWSAQAKSADGRYIVTAETLRPGGWGTAGPAQTTVDLNYTSGSQGSAEILTFVGEPDRPDDMNVGINWLGPTHLELTYKGHPTIEFQAVKCRGVEIVTRSVNGPAPGGVSGGVRDGNL